MQKAEIKTSVIHVLTSPIGNSKVGKVVIAILVISSFITGLLMKNIPHFLAGITLLTFVTTSTVSAFETINNGEEVITVPSTAEEQLLWEKAFQAEQLRAEKARSLQKVRQAQYRANPKPAVYQPRQQQAQHIPEAGELFDAASGGNIQQIGRLLDQGIDINTANAERETALHMAAARGHYRAVIYLVKNGAYVNAKTIKNWIPLHHATRFNRPNIVNYLLKHGASAHQRTTDGLNAIDMAKSLNDNRLLSVLGAR